MLAYAKKRHCPTPTLCLCTWHAFSHLFHTATLWVWLLLSLDHGGLHLHTLSGQVYFDPLQLWGHQWEQGAPPWGEWGISPASWNQGIPFPSIPSPTQVLSGILTLLSCMDGACSNRVRHLAHRLSICVAHEESCRWARLWACVWYDVWLGLEEKTGEL